MTHISTVTNETVVQKILDRSVQVLQDGGVILYPTDTVYGLGVDATNRDAVKRIQCLKQRSDTKSFLVMVKSVVELEKYALLTSTAQKLAKQFLPGPLSLVLPVRDGVLEHIKSIDGYVGFRIPHHPYCMNLLSYFSNPVVTTSANLSGFKEEHTIENILQQFGVLKEEISLAIDGGVLSSERSSTIIKISPAGVQVLREGLLPISALSHVLEE